MSESTFELFHSIVDADSASARRYLVEHALFERVRFRNIVYPEVLADFQARGGVRLPALWTGQTLIEGLPAVLAALAQFR